MKPPPLSLYVHLPWCVRKCPYCDFNSHAAGSRDQTGRYLQALDLDLECEAASGRGGGREIGTIFLGGGTPSLFSPSQIAAILASAAAHFDVSRQAEITMEANPGTLERGALDGYRQAGVNRLSLGAQSFDAPTLERLGRIHSPGDIVVACEEARTAGFDNLNLDLMFALPGQDLEQSISDVERAISMQPSHISYYQLTLEPNTVFFSRPPADLPDEDSAFAMQTAGHDRLLAAGFHQYEISAFAQDGRRCLHNLNYWQFGDYLAVGAGAHGKFTTDARGIYRYRKPANPGAYMEHCEAGRVAEAPRRIGEQDLVFEYMLNALRLPEGFAESAFAERTGVPVAMLGEAVGRATRDGMLERNERCGWRPTTLGLRFLNDLQAQFLPPSG